MFCSDIGTKYKYNPFNKIYKLCGIIHENTRYHPKMNGKVERKNKKITKLTIAIILNYSVASFWHGEILLNVYYVMKKNYNIGGSLHTTRNEKIVENVKTEKRLSKDEGRIE